MKKKSNIKIIVFVFLLMTLSAISESTRGVFIPIFKQDFSIKNTEIGYMLTVSSLGYTLFTYIGGVLCEKVGQKKVFVMGSAAMMASLGLLSITNSFYMLLLNMFLLNIGISLIAISINTLVPLIFISFQAILMNLTHFCYGLGSSISQRVTGILIYNNVSWRKIYLYLSMVYIIVLIVTIFLKIPEPHKKATSKTSKVNKELNIRLLIFYMLALGFYVFAECGTQSWFVNFMQEEYKFDFNVSSRYLSLFFAIFAVGRFVGGFIVEKFGYIHTVFISLFMALILYFSGIFIGKNGMIIISIAGFFFSITFPTIVLTISKVFKENSSYITGIIITSACTINMLLNIVMGKLNDTIGTYKAFYMIPISLFISMVFVYLINKSIKERLT